MRWLHRDGSYGPVRCGAPNKCRYCAMLVAFENALVIKLDALNGAAWPNMTVTTTTAKRWEEMPQTGKRSLVEAEHSLRVHLRTKYGRQVEWVGFVEFTTGLYARDGARRAHVHHLVKGLPTLRPCGVCSVCTDGPVRAVYGLCALGAFTHEVRGLWKGYTQGAWRVEVSPLRTPAGAVAYFALHHQKEHQKPPAGWKGRRFRATRAYFARPVEELRREARSLLHEKRIERELVRAWDVPDGFDGDLLDELIDEALPAARERALEDRPVLVKESDGWFTPAPRLDGQRL